ncbi:MAG: MFS transporter [Oscillospiraceae bacterium]|nr:MFS transporter [Oscillospiraceae bacterium]
MAAKNKLAEQIFGAEEHSAATLAPEKLGQFREIASRMFRTPQLTAKERGMPALATVGRSVSELISGGSWMNIFLLSVLRIDMVYLVIMGTLLGFYNTLIRPLMGIAYDRTRTRWGKARPYAMLAPVLYYAATALLFSGRLFFDNDITNDPRKILFVFAMRIIRDTLSLIYKIPTDNYTSLMSPNPEDRIGVGLWQSYAGRWSGNFIAFMIMPLLDGARSGILNISQGAIFAGFGIAAAFFGIGGNLMMAANCRERLMLQPKPAPPQKALFYILKNKYALRNFIASFATSWWSQGGYSWDVVTQLEIYGGFVNSTFTFIPGHIVNAASLALVKPISRMFGGDYRKSVIFWRIWDTVVDIIPAFLGFIPSIIGSWWKIAIIFAISDVLNRFNDAPTHIMESEIGREIDDYTEYVTGERPDGSIGLLTNWISRVMDAPRALMTIAVFKWSGYDPNIAFDKRWSQDVVRENSTMYSRVFFLNRFTNILGFIAGLIPLFMYDLTGKKREDMYAALNERRALVAEQDIMSAEMAAMMEMMEKQEALEGKT